MANTRIDVFDSAEWNRHATISNATLRISIDYVDRLLHELAQLNDYEAAPPNYKELVTTLTALKTWARRANREEEGRYRASKQSKR